MEIILYISSSLILGLAVGWLLCAARTAATFQKEKDAGQLKYSELDKDYASYKATVALQLNTATESLNSSLNEIAALKQTNDGYIKDIADLNNQVSTANAELKAANQTILEKNTAIEVLNEELKTTQKELSEINKELATANATNVALNEKLQTQKDEMEVLGQKFNKDFELIANKVLDSKTEKFTELNKTNLKTILDPLGDKINEFKGKVEEVYIKEASERFSLGEKVKELAQLNKVISEEAHNLTKALKGEAKTQGRWGEMILESILEKSGLVKDREYFMEHQLLDENGKPLKSDSEDKKMRPDAVIKYPDNRNVIIDSKVSLNAFTRLIASTDVEEQKQELQAHISAIKTHIVALSAKGYDDYDKALDFVMMFIPSEPAYIAALQGDPDLWNFAYDKRILLLSPTNLITSLKLIVDLWKREYQNQNAKEIAERGAKLYDKFVGFVKNLEEVGDFIDKAKTKYTEAHKLLTTGKDNLVTQANKLKSLGLKTKKELPKSLEDGTENQGYNRRQQRITMAEGTKEMHFEEHIVKYLTKTAQPVFPEYTEKDNSVYDKELCLIPEDVIGFIKDTQPQKYKALEAQYGPAVDSKIFERAADELKKRKTLEVFRGKVKDRGQNLDLVFFKPAHNKTPEHQENYEKNRFTIIRQLKYSNKNANSIDLVLFVNGLPVVTMELKNALTGQYLHHAIKQYIENRDPKEPLLEFQRCLVHFAVSTEKVSMCTELKGKSTFFLPFDKELVNKDDNDYATSYLWKDVLRKDSLLDIIQNYANTQVVKEKYFDPHSGVLKEKVKTILIFPRFHQRRAVQNLVDAIRIDGVGSKYLIQHSAGSGKSNTISWLAHRLSGFYRQPDDSRAMFNTVIVVTDRRVLDKQIQDNIRQFEQTPGEVEYIDKNKSGQDLKDAIEKGKRIIVTTLQKFPVISDVVAQNKDKTYAVIIDEAHSSQAGESARHLRKALSLEEAETADGEEKDLDDLIAEEIKKKGDQTNISFFAFTATPKPKTLELFGTVRNGQKVAFDLYTMEQAIKEGFIKDVLKNYVSWKRYYKLIKRTDIDDKEYDKKKTVRLLSSYVDLQDHAIEKKARVMIEHFVAQTQNEMRGEARAMLVTRSRLHAVRYKRKFDDIMREMKLPYSALVAFSGTVTDADVGQDFTKENMNNLGGKIEIPEAFKLPQHRILIVANMYQTGFDEPKLHTMFVDKKLGGSSTVQTLSRLNRTAADKDTTMVLDFVNDPEKVQEDFQMYYGSNYMELDDQTDPNSLYDLQNMIDSFGIIYKNDIESYAELFFKKGDHKEKLQPILNEVADRFIGLLDEDQKLSMKTSMKSFVRLYRFVSQIISFTDVQLEKYYVFLSDLYKKLPSSPNSLPLEVLEEIDLDSYKLQRLFEVNLPMESIDTPMEGMTPGGEAKKDPEELEWLTKIIKVLNDTYGLELKDEDKVEFERMKQNIYANDGLMSFFNAQNSKDNIQDKFNEEVDNELLNFINTKLEFYNKLSEDRANMMFKRLWFNDIYDKRVRGIVKGH